MKFRGIIILILVLSLLVTCLSFEVSALKIDGALNDKEWKTAEKVEIISSSDTPNCGIEYGMVYIFCNESESRIYLGFKAKLSDEIDENSLYGAAVSADSGDFIYVTADGISDYNTGKYGVEGEVCSYADSVFSVEIALGIKYGLSTVDTLRIRFVDVTGSPSNVYTVSIPHGDLSHSEPSTLPINNNSGGADGTTERTTKVKTTKPKTTKPKTTKVKTTKAKTTKVKTTKAKTTKAKTTKTDSTLNSKYTIAAEQTAVATTADPYGEETTVLTVREVKLQKGFTYASVCVLILLALGICLAVNYARDKEKSKDSKKKEPDKKD